VNPGYLTRKQAGGTFARFTIHPMAREDFPDNVQSGFSLNANGEEILPEMYHGVEGRTGVEIVRI
jgi:hypothetical protein